MLQVLTRALFASYHRRAKRVGGVHAPRCGAVTFVQRFGDALDLNLHFHTLVLDGAYEGAPESPEADPVRADALAGDEPLLAELASASVRGRIAPWAPGPQAACCASERAWRRSPSPSSPVAAARAKAVSASMRTSRCRHARATRSSACAATRLERRWRDGTNAIVFEPIELVEKLAALVPPPRFHMTRYHGVLAPRARGRDRITPSTGRIPV